MSQIEQSKWQSKDEQNAEVTMGSVRDNNSTREQTKFKWSPLGCQQLVDSWRSTVNTGAAQFFLLFPYSLAEKKYIITMKNRDSQNLARKHAIFEIDTVFNELYLKIF